MLELTGAVLQPVCGIYEIKNTQTGQCYIGQSNNIPSRWASHFAALGRGKHNLCVMQRDWVIYGPDNFVASVVKIVDDESTLLAEEAAIARKYIDSGTKLYNSRIDGWLNEEELAAQVARVRWELTQEEGVLQRKRANKNEKRNQNGSDRGDDYSLQTDGGIQSRGGLFGDSTGSPVESVKWGLRKPEAGLLASEQGVDTEAGTERPTSQGMAENGRRRKRDQDDREVFPIFDRYAADVLAEHLPEDEREQYLQDLIADTKAVTGGGVIDIGLFILAAFSKEDVAEIREILDPSVLSFFLDEEKYADSIAYFDNVTATYPGGLKAWMMDKINQQE